MLFTNALSGSRTSLRSNRLLQAEILLFAVFWVYTFLFTSDRPNWFLENLLTVIFLGILITTYRRFVFSDLSYLLLFIYFSMHVYGSMKTYAENPLGFRLMEILDWERNHYDRMVHFAFGFLLAYPMRELFLAGMKYPAYVGWILPIEVTLSFSGGYELVEWAVADLFFSEQGPAYLGTQGDIWDAQKDIALAFSGAIIATTLVSVIRKFGKI